MIIKGAKVYTEEGIFADKEVCITGEVFTETGGDGEKVSVMPVPPERLPVIP